jgi:hypothetical protein
VTAELAGLLGEDAVAYYPAWETLPHERLSPRADTVGRRLAVLRRLSGRAGEPVPSVVVAPIRSVLQPQVKGLADMAPVRLAVGEEYPLSTLLADLSGAAYNRGTWWSVGECGAADRRLPAHGGTPCPHRLFGDEVEEIRPPSRTSARRVRRWIPWWRRRAASCSSPRCAPAPSGWPPSTPSWRHAGPIAEGQAVWAWRPSPRCWSMGWNCCRRAAEGLAGGGELARAHPCPRS